MGEYLPVANDAFTVAFLAQTTNGNAWLLTAENQIRMMLGHEYNSLSALSTLCIGFLRIYRDITCLTFFFFLINLSVTSSWRRVKSFGKKRPLVHDHPPNIPF